jgi:hypothetical protein
MKTCLQVCILFGCAIVTAAALMAQESSYSVFTASVGAGFTAPVYRSGAQLDTGWNFQGQAGINFFNARGALVGEFDYNRLGVNSTTLSALQFPGGTADIWSFSADPVIRFHPQGRVDFYLIGGPGVYHRTIDFTTPTVTGFTGFDPFLGVFFPVGVPGNQVVASYSTTKLGVNGGAGFNLHVGDGHAKFFA